VHWRLLSTPALGGAENMALDEALMHRAARTGEAVLRLYAWSAPTLSLGRNQPARDEYDAAALAGHGVDVVRRLTGGRAVLHHREITYSVTAPIALGATLGDAYARINRLLVAGLRSLGAEATVAEPTRRAPIPSASPCFEEPTAGELVLGGRKLVGSAQYREGDALLQHGSILVDDDQALVTQLRRTPASPSPAPATLREALGRVPSRDEVDAAFLGALRALEDEDAASVGCAELALDTSRVLPRYRSAEWTWRR
jgi:lipoate-protein ligase A